MIGGMSAGMRKRRSFCAGLLLIAAWPVVVFAGTVRSGGTIAAGTRWATAYAVQETGLPGPVVLVVGGVHGNEPAGARAAGQILHWTITRGKLIVIPRANTVSLREGHRFLPTKADRNLNRNFPRAADEAPRGELAAAIWQFVRDARPAWLIDLHESMDYRRRDKKRYGNSIIHYPEAAATRAALRMIAAADATIAEADKAFVLLRFPAKGSLTRAAAERLGAYAMILETKWPKQPLSLRTRQHRMMVHRLLHDLEMLSGGVDVLCPLTRRRDEVRLALYDAGGVGGAGPVAFDKLFRALPGTRLERVGPAEILAGALRQFDVVIFPGGSGSRQGKAITPRGRQAVRRFVGNGGGYVGICAGAYLAASNYAWSLRILDAKVIDRAHWKRGKAMVKVDLTAEGRRMLGKRPAPFDVRYANGPLLAPGERPEIPDFTALAHFRSEVAKGGAPKGVMINTPAMAAGRWGKGRVFVSSPHPESTPGLDPALIRRAVLWAAGRPEIEAN